uniref:Uncharacterized protein n=1 Tax=Arundo donax TaxID=35708 RepID=A0A0A9FMT5_ARUDO
MIVWEDLDGGGEFREYRGRL